MTIELVFAPTLSGHYQSRGALLQEVVEKAAAGLPSGEAGHGRGELQEERLEEAAPSRVGSSVDPVEAPGQLVAAPAVAAPGPSLAARGGSVGGGAGPSVAAPLAQAVIPMTPRPVPVRRSLSVEEQARAFPRMSSMVLERGAPPPIMFDQPKQAADNGEAGLHHEAAGESDERVICVICMGVINEHQEEARLPCNHVLHCDCVDRSRSVAGMGEDQCPTHCERWVQQRDQVAPADDLDERRSENQVVAEFL